MRSDAAPVVPVRGVPADVGYTVKEKIEGWGDCLHTLTWLTPAEFREAISNVEAARYAELQRAEMEGKEIPAYMRAPFVDREWRALKAVLSTLSDIYGEDGVRLIVGFDN